MASDMPPGADVENRTEDGNPQRSEAGPQAGSLSPSPIPVWKDFYQRDVRKAIGRKRPLLNAASFNADEKAAVGIFSIPKRKRKKFRAVTEIHYHNACNELVRFLMGQLTCIKDPAISKYLSYEDFERDKYKFHKAKIERLKFEKLIGPDESFTIAMEVRWVKKAKGSFFAQFGVSNAVTGRLLYCYTPNESS